MKKKINKTEVPVEDRVKKIPKKKNFKFLKFRRIRPEKGKVPNHAEEAILNSTWRNNITFEEWMKVAKQYAKESHNITFRSNHCFWRVVTSHWTLKNGPEIGVKDAIKIFWL